MKIRFTEYIDSGALDFNRIIRDAGYAHEVDAEDVKDKIWYGSGTREIAVKLELDTETGIIKVIA